jgi:hypothetical protein
MIDLFGLPKTVSQVRFSATEGHLAACTPVGPIFAAEGSCGLVFDGKHYAAMVDWAMRSNLGVWYVEVHTSDSGHSIGILIHTAGH